MKKNCIIIGLGVLVMCYVNFSIVNSKGEMTHFSLDEIEALADSELNNWNEWFSQGLTKDEREWIRPCPNQEYNSGYVEGGYGGANIGAGGSHGQVNPSGRNEITCPYGNQNCTSVDCD